MTSRWCTVWTFSSIGFLLWPTGANAQQLPFRTLQIHKRSRTKRMQQQNAAMDKCCKQRNSAEPKRHKPQNTCNREMLHIESIQQKCQHNPAGKNTLEKHSWWPARPAYVVFWCWYAGDQHPMPPRPTCCVDGRAGTSKTRLMMTNDSSSGVIEIARFVTYSLFGVYS